MTNFVKGAPLAGVQPLVEIYTNGKIYSGFKSVKITRNLEALASDFDLTCAYSASDGAVQIDSGVDVVIKINDQKVLTGYIDNVSHTISKDNREIMVTGRSKTADLIDCSAGVIQIKDRDPHAIATEICKPFGIKAVWDTKRTKTKVSWKVEPGETCFEVLGKIARMNNLILTTNANGDCVFTEPKNDDLGTVTLGVELLEITTNDDHSQRYSDYICMGDSPSHKTSADGKSESDYYHLVTGAKSSRTKNKSTVLGKGRAKTTVKDLHITRYRPMITLSDDNATGQNTQERAEYERDRAFGHGRTVEAKLRGWTYLHNTQDPDTLVEQVWDVNKLLKVDADFLQVSNEQLLIVTVQLILDQSEGYVALMTLAPPEGYSSMMYNAPEKSEAKKGKKKKGKDRSGYIKLPEKQ